MFDVQCSVSSTLMLMFNGQVQCSVPSSMFGVGSMSAGCRPDSSETGTRTTSSSASTSPAGNHFSVTPAVLSSRTSSSVRTCFKTPSAALVTRWLPLRSRRVSRGAHSRQRRERFVGQERIRMIRVLSVQRSAAASSTYCRNDTGQHDFAQRQTSRARETRGATAGSRPSLRSSGRRRATAVGPRAPASSPDGCRQADDICVVHRERRRSAGCLTSEAQHVVVDGRPTHLEFLQANGAPHELAEIGGRQPPAVSHVQRSEPLHILQRSGTPRR